MKQPVATPPPPASAPQEAEAELPQKHADGAAEGKASSLPLSSKPSLLSQLLFLFVSPIVR